MSLQVLGPITFVNDIKGIRNFLRSKHLLAQTMPVSQHIWSVRGNGPVSQEILSLGNSVAATIFPRKSCRFNGYSDQIYLGKSVATRKFCRSDIPTTDKGRVTPIIIIIVINYKRLYS